jgi:hypothetical protein
MALLKIVLSSHVPQIFPPFKVATIWRVRRLVRNMGILHVCIYMHDVLHGACPWADLATVVRHDEILPRFRHGVANMFDQFRLRRIHTMFADSCHIDASVES